MRLSPLLSFPLSALLLSASLAASLSASLLVSTARADDTVASDDDDFFKSDDKPKPPDVPDASAFNSGDDDAISIAAPIKVEPPAPKPAPVGPSRRAKEPWWGQGNRQTSSTRCSRPGVAR